MGKIEYLTFLDIETTALAGPEACTDAIVEIAASRINIRDRDEPAVSFEALIRPWGAQTLFMDPPDDLRLTWDFGEYHTTAGHFAGVDWSKAIKLSAALDMITETLLTDGATMAGHNPHFDLRYLRRHFDYAGRPFPAIDYHVIDLCSPAIFLVMMGEVETPSLRFTGPWAGCKPQRHRAMDDVRDAIRVFWHMYDEFSDYSNAGRTLEDVIRSERKAAPFGRCEVPTAAGTCGEPIPKYKRDCGKHGE